MTAEMVFVVNDDEAVRDSLKFLMESIGLTAETYSCASGFLDSFDPDKPGCLILDIRMPGMTGLDLQKELANRHSLLPIIFITGHGDVPMAVQAVQQGAIDFIQKTFPRPQIPFPFFSTKESGMGIGLAICRTVVESHHGELNFENNSTGGTTFNLTLPIDPEVL